MFKVLAVICALLFGGIYLVDYLGSREQVSTVEERYSFDIYCDSGECTSALPGCRGTLDYVVECIEDIYLEEE